MKKRSRALEMLDEESAGHYLGGVGRPISKGTLRFWRDQGTGPIYAKMGRAIRYEKSNLDAFIEANLRTCTSDAGSR